MKLCPLIQVLEIYPAFLFGALIEILQGTMGLGRDGDWHDLVADSVGIALAYVVWTLVRRLGWAR